MSRTSDLQKSFLGEHSQQNMSRYTRSQEQEIQLWRAEMWDSWGLLPGFHWQGDLTRETSDETRTYLNMVEYTKPAPAMESVPRPVA